MKQIKTNTKDSLAVKIEKEQWSEFEKQINSMSKEDVKDLLLINTYKLNITRAQVEALMEIVIKNKLASYEDIWKRTNEIMKNSK